jgi:fluoroacetyl-CoA thioesterase
MKSRRSKQVRKNARRARKRASKPRQSSDGDRPRLGLEASVERLVLPEWTIQHLNPSLPPVFSTPAMIGLMEQATVMAVMPELPAGTISVGTRIEVDHLKAVAPGAPVRASAKLVGYRGRFLIFHVEARSGELLIGRGRVFRAIVHPETHKSRAQARLPQ